MKNTALQLFINKHKAANDQLRLGQRFVNLYIKNPWPELFYERNEGKAAQMIRDWLCDHQYMSELPQPIIRLTTLEILSNLGELK